VTNAICFNITTSLAQDAAVSVAKQRNDDDNVVDWRWLLADKKKQHEQ